MNSHRRSSEKKLTPENDGAAKHLIAGTRLPDVALTATHGAPVNLARYQERAIVFIYPFTGTPGAPNPMAPVITLAARILQLHRVPAGGTVGYNSQWTARRNTLLATIGIGYADGFPRLAGGTDVHPDGAHVMIAKKRCPIVGRVSMDLTVIDVTEAPASVTQPGAVVEVLNSDITIDELASHGGVSAYTVLTGLGARYHRVYVSG